MTDSSRATTKLLITCPVCAASGAMIHHDLRSSLVYSCLNCTHEWEIVPVREAASPEPPLVERRRKGARTKTGLR